MIALTADGYRVVGAKGVHQRPHSTFESALRAMYAGASASCSDGACGAQGVPLANSMLHAVVVTEAKVDPDVG